MKKIVIALVALLTIACATNVFANPINFKFGILKQLPDGSYEMDVETKRIPRHVKASGFRFGISFDNPDRKYIEWHEAIHLPGALKQLSGGLQKSGENVVISDLQATTASHIVDQFWFDSEDPLGVHRLEVYVNGAMKFHIDFEVVLPAKTR